MFEDPVVAEQALTFVAALVLAYFTGTWRQAGRRMQRLLELAEKLPPGSEVRAKFQAEAVREQNALQPNRWTRTLRTFDWHGEFSGPSSACRDSAPR